MQPDQEKLQETAVLIERFVAVGAFIILLAAVVLILRPFFSAIIFGGIIAIATWPLHEWLVRKGLSSVVVASILTLLALALVVGPTVVAAPKLVRQLIDVAPRVQDLLSDQPNLPIWIAHLPLFGPKIEQLWSQLLQGQAQDILSPYTGTIRSAITTVAGALAEAVLQIVLALALAAMLWLRGGQVSGVLRNAALRFAGGFGRKAIDEAATSIRGVAYGVVGTAVAQAVALAGGLWIVGVPGAGLLGFLSLLIALSQVGILLVVIWGGAAWWLVGHDAVLSAIFIVVWGLFVSLADNVIRPLLVGYGTAMPLLLVFLGVLGGFVTFGFLGLFIGPTVLATFFSLLQAWDRTSTS